MAQQTVPVQVAICRNIVQIGTRVLVPTGNGTPNALTPFEGVVEEIRGGYGLKISDGTTTITVSQTMSDRITILS